MEKQITALGELMVLAGSLKGQAFQITRERCRIGRQPDGLNDVLLPEGTISRHHAEISLVNGNWMIQKVSPNNSIFVDKQEVAQYATLHNRSLIRLGKEVELLFLSFVPEPITDSGAASTIYGTIPAPRATPPQESTAIPASDDPFKNPGHPVWQVTGILTSFSGILAAVEVAIQDSNLQRWAQLITAILTLGLCALMVGRARVKSASSRQAAAVPPRLHTGKSILYTLWSNIFLVVAAAACIVIVVAVAFTSSFSPQVGNALGISVVLLVLGILLSYITLIVQMFFFAHKKIIPGARFLWISALIFGSALLLGVGAYVLGTMHPAGIIAGVAVVVIISAWLLGLESVATFGFMLVYLLIRGLVRLFSADTRVQAR